MQKYFNNVANKNGRAVYNAFVTVSVHGGALATIYSDNGVTTAPNPLSTDHNGYFEFYAADGRYDITIQASDIDTEVITDILLEDPADGSAALAAPGGAALIGFLQSGTGAVARTVQNKLREILSPEDFGAVGDGVTNDRPAFVLALAAFGTRGGVLQLGAKKYLIDGGDLTVPENVTVRGQSPQAGTNVPSFDFYGFGSTLIIDGTSGYSIRLSGASSGIECAYIMRKGLPQAADITDAALLQAAINAFAGTAVYISGNDAGVRQLCIVGFNQAIRHNGTLAAGYVRQRISYIIFDCTNGIEIDLSGDLGDIYYCRGFPFFSAFRGGFVTDANNLRSGTAFYAPGTYDWANFTNCNSFGWQTGFLINDCNNIELVNCGADTIQNTAGSISFSLTGTCQDAKLLGCRATAKTGYKFNITGHAMLNGCSGWGSDVLVDVVAGDVTSTGSYWQYLKSGGGTAVLRAGSGAGYVTLQGDRLDNTSATYPVEPFVIDAAAASKFRIFGVTYKSCTTGYTDSSGGTWKDWTPSYTSGSGTLTTITTNNARYQTVGKTVHFRLFFTVTNNGTGATDFRITLPLTVSGSSVAVGRNLNTGSILQAQIISSGLNEARVFKYDNTYPVATGNGVLISGSYETT